MEEDNDPKHKSKISTKWKLENLINLMTQPAYSFNQTPIENVWLILNLKKAYKNKKQFKDLKPKLQKNGTSCLANLL